MKAISTRIIGPTDTKPARVVASDGDGNRVMAPYHWDGFQNTRSNPHDAAALALCNKMGWSGTLIRGSTKNGYVYVWANDDYIVAGDAK